MNYKRIALIVVLSLLMLSLLLFAPHPKGVVQEDLDVWKHDLDSILANDKKIAVTMRLFQIRRTNDSLRIASIQSKLDSFDLVTNNIIAKYEKERASIIALPLNDRIRFFSGWLHLPQTDSL